MRYPRAFFVFDKQEILPDEEHFKGLANSHRRVYLSGVSKPIKTLDEEVAKIKSIDAYFKQYSGPARDVLVVSNPNAFDFLAAYLADKTLKLFWLDSLENSTVASMLISSIFELEHMKGIFHDAFDSYGYALRNFLCLMRRHPYPEDDWIYRMHAFAADEVKTVLESELRVLIQSKLSINIFNRIDL